MKRLIILFLFGVLPASAAEISLEPTAFLPPTLDSETLNIGSRRELFVDNTIIGSLTGTATRQLFKFQPATTGRTDVAMTWDKDWEGSWCRYGTYIQEGALIRAWYTACHTDGNHKNRSCYAVSRDGLKFTKPVLGLYDWKGSKQNNVMFDQHTFKNTDGGWVDQSHNFAPFIDTNPGVAGEAKYKGVGGLGEKLGFNTGLYAFQSADGVHWKLASKNPILSNQYRFDSKNQAFWDESRKRYAVYFRNLRNSQGQIGIKVKNWRRDIMVSFSDDFSRWTEPQFLVYHRNDGKPGMNLDHLYTNEIKPYKRAPHIYLGFPARLISRSRVQPMFMASRDGIHFYRWLDHAMIPLSDPADRNKNRSNHIWQEMVEIAGEPNHYSMYASENLGISGHHQDGSFPRLRRYTIRKDGFVSIRADGSGGELVTKPLIFAGTKLTVNYNARLSDGGRLKVALLDNVRQPIPGFSLTDCDELSGDEIDQEITWKENPDVSSLAGKEVHLQFVFENADLFSFKFSLVL